MRCSIEKIALAVLFIFFADSAAAQGPAADLARDGYSHDRFGTQPRDYVRGFRAFIVSFDTEDEGRARGVPEWVAYELRRKPSGIGPGASRPSKWQTDPILHQRQAAPNDATYRGSGYDRGHLCMKSHAWRLGREADRGSHTILNACPQVPSFNRGIWLGLELLTGEWADIYGRVWVVAGPVFYPDREVKTIGDEGEVPADIPHAFYKVVVRENPAGNLAVLAFLFPHFPPGDKTNWRKRTGALLPYLVSVDQIEKLTGLDFLARLPDEVEAGLESVPGSSLWPRDSKNRLDSTKGERGTDAPSVINKGEKKSGAGPSNRALKLRTGIAATKAEMELARSIQAAGWLYVMPIPKSSKAKWGNYDRRTIWWREYWINVRTGKISSREPLKGAGFSGDGLDLRGSMRRGSPSRKPTVIEWLCSESKGAKP